VQSAAVVVDHVLDIFPVNSVVDVGCGPGFWLKIFADRGVRRITGIDGEYTDRTRLAIDPACFIGRDLNRRLIDLNLGKFDLAMSLEVGEHLLPERAESLVDDLCALSDFVMYAAAIERQGGDQYVNERWQS
jgi:2-polyprenyl-3-methyl-5-hydroxy-6-metoxy-1,4-benzoquinol methylase